MCVGKVTNAKVDGIPLRHPKIKPLKSAGLVGDVKLVNGAGQLPYMGDSLALVTHYTKIVLFSINDLFKRMLVNTTQPAHFVTALAVIVVSFLMMPRQHKVSHVSPLWTLVYLGSFSAHFGAQIWMTFISGLALYFSLPRHTFGSIQQVLFPKYFLLNAGLSLATLAIYLKANNSNLQEPDVALQVGAMTICFLVELLIRLYLTPPLLRLMTAKNKIEKSAGVGMEIGKLNAGDLLNCPHYSNINKAFRKVHMTIAMGNIIAMCCTMFHLYHLSQKLCFV